MNDLHGTDIISNDSVIKSIQRGNANQTTPEIGGNADPLTYTFELPISTIDVNKSVLQHSFKTSAHWGSFQIKSISLSNNKISVKASTQNSGSGGTYSLSGDWVLIEFY